MDADGRWFALGLFSFFFGFFLWFLCLVFGKVVSAIFDFWSAIVSALGLRLFRLLACSCLAFALRLLRLWFAVDWLLVFGCFGFGLRLLRLLVYGCLVFGLRLFRHFSDSGTYVRRHLGTGGWATEQMSDVGRTGQGPMCDENREGGRVTDVCWG